MLKVLSENEIKLLSIISRLIATNRQPTVDSILHIMEIRIPDLLDCWEQTVQTLINKGIVLYETDNETIKGYNVTEYGEKFIENIEQNNYLTLFFYNEFYKRAKESKAHSEFCRLVYGQDFSQHGMLDMNQLHKLIDVVNINFDSNVLELGCGSGYITEYISDKTRCHITGIDIAAEAIEHANKRTIKKRDRVIFDTKSMENLDYPDNSFDAVISIDTLYFVGNLESTLQSMSRVLKPGGSMYIFYHVPPYVGNVPDSDPASCSNLGRVLDRSSLKFQTIDFTKENMMHWELKKQVLLDLKAKFEEEGNMFLYNNRMEECKGNLGEFYRYLFIVRKS